MKKLYAYLKDLQETLEKRQALRPKEYRQGFLDAVVHVLEFLEDAEEDLET